MERTRLQISLISLLLLFIIIKRPVQDIGAATKGHIHTHTVSLE